MADGTNLDTYRSQQDALLAKQHGKILARHDCKLVGIFDSKTEAMQDMKKRFEPGSFLIIKCVPGDAECTRRFHSRVLV